MQTGVYCGILTAPDGALFLIPAGAGIMDDWFYIDFFHKGAIISNMEEKKSGRGGKRPGSGRKPTGDTPEGKNYTTSVTGTKKELETLKALAAEKNLTVSRYIIDSLVYGKF